MKSLFSKLSSKRVSPVLLAVTVLAGCGPGSLEADEDLAPVELGTTAQPLTYNGHDYLIVPTSKTWQDARAYCMNAGYYLVTIDSAAEEAFLNDQEIRKGLTRWWMGYNDIVTEGVWDWIGTESTTYYSNWAPGEPNNDGGQDCGVDRFNGTDQWDDDSCGKSHPFICERDALPTTSNGSFSFKITSSTSNATVNTSNHSVYVPAGRILTVGTCGLSGASAVGDTYLRLNNPSGQEIASNDDAGGSCGGGSNLSIVTSVSGSYVIRAGCFMSKTCEGTVAYSF